MDLARASKLGGILLIGLVGLIHLVEAPELFSVGFLSLLYPIPDKISAAIHNSQKGEVSDDYVQHQDNSS